MVSISMRQYPEVRLQRLVKSATADLAGMVFYDFSFQLCEHPTLRLYADQSVIRKNKVTEEINAPVELANDGFLWMQTECEPPVKELCNGSQQLLKV